MINFADTDQRLAIAANIARSIVEIAEPLSHRETALKDSLIKARLIVDLAGSDPGELKQRQCDFKAFLADKES